MKRRREQDQLEQARLLLCYVIIIITIIIIIIKFVCKEIALLILNLLCFAYYYSRLPPFYC